MTTIDVVSDLHGYYPELPGGDLLIVAGDLTARGLESEYFRCFDWLYEQDYRKKIVVAGNHDTQMQEENYKGPEGIMKGAFDYLCDSGTEFNGLKLWGCPWTKTFDGMNPKCKAFTVDTEFELFDKWSMIPDDTDILITHSPPFGSGDTVISYTVSPNGEKRRRYENAGSQTLLQKVRTIVPKLHVFGHIHQGYGKYALDREDGAKIPTVFVNASIMNEFYEPVNKPIRIDL